jgi:hypothetical protein
MTAPHVDRDLEVVLAHPHRNRDRAAGTGGRRCGVQDRTQVHDVPEVLAVLHPVRHHPHLRQIHRALAQRLHDGHE